MVGTNKWTDEQILRCFELYHMKGLSKDQVANQINQEWPRRAATKAGVNYVLNTKKRHIENRAISKPATIKNAARAAAKLAGPTLVPAAAASVSITYPSPPQPPLLAPTPSFTPSYQPHQYAVNHVSAWQAEYVGRRTSVTSISTPSPLVSSLSQPAPMAVLNSAVSAVVEELELEREGEEGKGEVDPLLKELFEEEVAKWAEDIFELDYYL